MKKHLLITILTFFLASPLAWANDLYYNIKQEFSVSKIQTELQAIIDNAFVNVNIVVTGSKTDVDATLTLTIAAGKKVVWQALFQATSTFTPKTLLMFLGDGTFEVAGGKLTSPAAMTINSYGENATVIVSNGTVSATLENAIITRGTNAKVYISGGEVSNISEGKYPVIYIYNNENTKQNVVVSGSAKVETIAAPCIISSGRVIISENAQVYSHHSTHPNLTKICVSVSAKYTEIRDDARIIGNVGIPDFYKGYEMATISDNVQVEGIVSAKNVIAGNKAKINGFSFAGRYLLYKN